MVFILSVENNHEEKKNVIHESPLFIAITNIWANKFYILYQRQTKKKSKVQTSSVDNLILTFYLKTLTAENCNEHQDHIQNGNLTFFHVHTTVNLSSP